LGLESELGSGLEMPYWAYETPGYEKVRVRNVWEPHQTLEVIEC